MGTTPNTKVSNSPQRVLKSIPPTEEISVNITKDVNGKDLKNILEGVAAFTGAFNDSDRYNLDVKVKKVIESKGQVIVDESK